MPNPTVTKWALRTCGLSTVHEWSNGYETNTNWTEFLEKTTDARWNGKPNGNILFVISTNQLFNPSAALKAALKHPGTRVIHAYKQNAHGPNWILVCMTHVYPDTNDLKGWTNNIKEVKAAFKFNEETKWYELNDRNLFRIQAKK